MSPRPLGRKSMATTSRFTMCGIAITALKPISRRIGKRARSGSRRSRAWTSPSCTGGSPWVAHPIVSFRFADALPLCFSIETRKAIGQQYSAVRGLYRQYTLIYIVADERDSIRVRSNYRHGEDVYLYRTMASPAQARVRFLEYLNTINMLHDHPRWYNAITTNCTTNIRTQRPTSQRAPWDWRMLVNGKADEMLYEHHAIATGGLPFSELKQRSLINKRARVADKDPDFSRLIREELPKGD